MATPLIHNTDQTVSINVLMDVQIGEEVKSLQLTARHGSKADDIVNLANALITAYATLREQHPKPEGKVSPSQADAPAEGKKKYEPKPVPSAELPDELPSMAEGGESEYFKDEFDYFEIAPQADGKASVKFYKDGLQWPVGAQINKWKNQNVAEALAPLGDFDASVAAKHRAAGLMFWVKGDEYIISQGAHKGEKSHYKNLKLIQAVL